MEDRKARLKALAAKAGREPSVDDGDADATMERQEESQTSGKAIKFRNYAPQDASLEPQATGETDDTEEPESKRLRTTTATSDNKTALEQALEEAQRDVRQQSSSTTHSDIAAPKKINWDLKRDIQAKMDKLERRTQRAIVSLLKERLEREAATEAGKDEEEEDLD